MIAKQTIAGVAFTFDTDTGTLTAGSDGYTIDPINDRPWVFRAERLEEIRQFIADAKVAAAFAAEEAAEKAARERDISVAREGAYRAAMQYLELSVPQQNAAYAVFQEEGIL